MKIKMNLTQKFFPTILVGNKLSELRMKGCHSLQHLSLKDSKRILIVGNPNVGKSALFHRLTGIYVTVSNYPGTTVALFRGTCNLGGEEYHVEDTPGLYSLMGVTEEERITREVVLSADASLILYVVEAKNLKRMLPLCLQLVEAGLPLILVINMMDEARSAGISINVELLEERLGIPVVGVSAVTGEGVGLLRRRMVEALNRPSSFRIDYGPAVEEAIRELSELFPDNGGLNCRTLALLAVQGDPWAAGRMRSTGPREKELLQDAISRLKARLDQEPAIEINIRLHDLTEQLCRDVFVAPVSRGARISQRISELTMNPLTGIPLMFLLLYFGLYKFVGQLGAGDLVDFIEGRIFESHINPLVNQLAERYIPLPQLRELLAMEYGVFTLGIRYAIAIVLPIVGTFFLFFSVIEDSGYLPRLAMIMDRLLKRIGLNGRAVIPLVLGFGCDTMATVVTRTLESRRERIIATLLLSLAIPCSAQLGVILGMMAQRPLAMVIWAVTITGVFLTVGSLAARWMPGDSPLFSMELPPMRWPRPKAVFIKTYSRMLWYFKEILPLFILASVLIWVGRMTRLFDLVLGAMNPMVQALGLPGETAVAFLFGFFRRDYGAAGLFDLHRSGGLTGHQLAVAAVTLTLFVPCVAQFLVMKKEHGLRVAVGIAAFNLLVALSVGAGLHLVLNVMDLSL
jgi:ferrous iron transport protein B